MFNCIYCNEPIGNECCTDRGGFPIHPFCNQQLNEELIVWEGGSGIADYPNDPQYKLPPWQDRWSKMPKY